MKTLALALLIPVAICTACSTKEESVATPTPASVDAPATAPATDTAPAAAPATAHVSLISAAGSSVKGDLTLTNEGTDVSIRGEVTGLAPGKEHGFHVHEVGECSLPDFKSAGEHFNPTKDPHGGPQSAARHLGDIPNVKADENGRAIVDVTAKGPTLGDTDAGPAEILGKALVVHAMPDDYKTQPSGGSGARIACGVIR
ncbi:MAG: superoxide dismutase family protein [Steroidobacteraceae bacterium]